MDSSSHVYQNKPGRDEYWNGGLASPDAKRNNSGFTLANDSDLLAFLDKIDKETDAANEVEAETRLRLNGVMKSLEDEIPLEAHTDNNIEPTDDKAGTDQMDSKKQGELTADGNSEANTVTSDIGEFTDYDVRADFDFFVNHTTHDDFGIIMQNYLNQDSVTDIMYSEPVDGYVEDTEVFYGSLWEDDLWQLNELPIIENYFASPQQEEFGINGTEFHDVTKLELYLPTCEPQ